MINRNSPESITATYIGNTVSEVPTLCEIHKFHQKSRQHIKDSLNSSRKDLADKIKSLKKRAMINAKSVGTKKALAETITLLQKAESIYSEALQSAKLDCANLAISIAEQVIGDSINIHTNGLARNIATAISQLSDRRDLKVSVNPSQYKDIETELKKLNLDYIELSANTNIPIGDSIIESISGILELNWRDRLEELKIRILTTLIKRS